jgi:hypothetical protein
MENKVTVEKVLSSIALFLLIMLAIAMPIDIISFHEDPQTYSRVYDLSTSEDNWEWEYLSGWVYIGILIVTGLTIIISRFINKRSETIRKINWAFLFIFFSSIAINILNWIRTGGDH